MTVSRRCFSSPAMWWLVVVAVGGVSGCGYDFDAAFSGSPPDAGVDVGNDGPTWGKGCLAPEENQGVCEPVMSGSWSGPVVVLSNPDGGEGKCPPGFVGPVGQAFMGVRASPVKCSCACAPPVGICRVRVDSYPTDSCDADASVPCAAPAYLASNACVTLKCSSSSQYVQSFIMRTPELVRAKCVAIPSSEAEEPVVEGRVVLCKVDSSSSPEGSQCGEGEACLPFPPGSSTAISCIYQAGSHTCPAAYPQRQVLHSAFKDERGCTPCACGDPSDVKCDASSVLASAGASCSGNPGVFHAGSCQTTTPLAGESGLSVSVGLQSQGGQCYAIEPESNGTVILEDPVTVCCRVVKVEPRD